MNVIFSTGSPRLYLKNTCAAIGIFDGVHLGHQYLIKKMMASARRLKARPIVVTFFPHPAHVLRPDLKLGYVSSLSDRLRRLDQMGVELCVIIRFTPAFARIEPQKFIKNILVKKLGVKAVFTGEDFRFGRDRSGDAALFKRLGQEYGYQMHALAPLQQGAAAVSSTRIRQLIVDGKLAQAAGLLGRPVSLDGKVVAGSHRGKGLGYPTANVAYEADIVPPRGVYVIRVIVGKKSYPAVANIGLRPSFKEKNPKLRLEAHIFDFHKDIYGQDVQVQFLKKIRNERRFPNPASLVRQLQKDEAMARNFFRI